MLSLKSPKIHVGVHCLKLRTKSMYINPVVDPDEATLYDAYDNSAYWCVSTQTGFGPTVNPFERISAAANAGVANSDIFRASDVNWPHRCKMPMPARHLHLLPLRQEATGESSGADVVVPCRRPVTSRAAR
jgi:hypothetical protein